MPFQGLEQTTSSTGGFDWDRNFYPRAGDLQKKASSRTPDETECKKAIWSFSKSIAEPESCPHTGGKAGIAGEMFDAVFSWGISR